MKSLLLTFDVEEFVVPLELGLNVNIDEMYEISHRGLKEIYRLLKKSAINSTFFVTAKFAKKYPEILRELVDEGHEIALHGYQHSHNYRDMPEKETYYYLKKSKELIEELLEIRIHGFRAPRFRCPKYEILSRSNILYDSSYHPTYIPREYNNFFGPRTPFIKNEIKVIPISTTPIFRLPFSWIWFRNIGLNYSKLCTRLTLIDQNYVNIYFHPWEFVNLEFYDFCRALPKLSIRRGGKPLIEKLEKYINWCIKNDMRGQTIHKYLKLE